jgi:hypothetical protein
LNILHDVKKFIVKINQIVTRDNEDTRPFLSDQDFNDLIEKDDWRTLFDIQEYYQFTDAQKERYQEYSQIHH